MKYARLSRGEREKMMDDLTTMPEFLAQRFAALSREQARQSGPGGGFSPVEPCWHLVDLEPEGYRVRIERLLNETEAWSQARGRSSTGVFGGSHHHRGPGVAP